MNSEELEQSLRTEFESYLKTVLAEIRQEATEFKTKAQAEVDKHKAQLNEAFEAYATKFDSEHKFDEAFRGSVAEHLRLARDEGARITADAMAEAEKLNENIVPVAAPVVTKYSNIRDAIADIGSKDSQSAILKSLVQHSADFAARGAFFIIKNEHFVGWKIFGATDEKAEDAVREIHFPTASDSILGASIRSLATVDASAGEHADDRLFLEPLHFVQTGRMHAIPLVARGRGVAVLYVDHGENGSDLNLEALEALVRVAGLTVELLAASQTAKSENRVVPPADFENAEHESYAASAPPVDQFEHIYKPATPTYESVTPVQPVETPPAAQAYALPANESYQETPAFQSPPVREFEAPKFEPTQFEAQHYEEPQFEVSRFDTPQVTEPVPYQVEPVAPIQYQAEPVYHVEETPVSAPSFTEYEPVQDSPFESPRSQPFEPATATFEETPQVMEYGSVGSVEPAVTVSPFDQAVETYEPASVGNGGFSKSVEPVIEAPVVVPPPKARLSDRPVDLPIEVPEEERRIHNDARRFARLLVSEIKLYNEKKVLEGRQAHDLYDRLREAIDRSREMYDKRVQPPVAAKFDYFHYELLSALADGNVERLGPGYPGASV